MAQSLLAHLYSHIRGSQEDVATLSLQYILSQSEELRYGFNRLIGSKLHVDVSDVAKYYCQATGDNQERPDLSGKNNLGQEQVLCEAKFYAGLTENQPLAYLERLRTENGKGLLFICPDARITSLWAKLQERCFECTVQEIDKTCVLVNGISMAIISWNEILTELQRIAVASVPESLSDLNQLDGYCKEMDMEAFIPFSSEELGAITAQKQQRYAQVIIKTMDLIHADKQLKTTKAVRNSYASGFEYKMKVNQLLVYLVYDELLWMADSSKETPFWLLIMDEDKKQSENLLSLFNSLPELDVEDTIYYNAYIALEPLVNATLDEVAEHLVKQIYYYLSMIPMVCTNNEL